MIVASFYRTYILKEPLLEYLADTRITLNIETHMLMEVTSIIGHECISCHFKVM